MLSSPGCTEAPEGCMGELHNYSRCLSFSHVKTEYSHQSMKEQPLMRYWEFGNKKMNPTESSNRKEATETISLLACIEPVTLAFLLLFSI